MDIIKIRVATLKDYDHIANAYIDTDMVHEAHTGHDNYKLYHGEYYMTQRT